jgi:hypothetical protein
LELSAVLKRTDINSILIIGTGPIPFEFPAKAGTHLSGAPAFARWVPACAGNFVFLAGLPIDA